MRTTQSVFQGTGRWARPVGLPQGRAGPDALASELPNPRIAATPLLCADLADGHPAGPIKLDTEELALRVDGYLLFRPTELR